MTTPLSPRLITMSEEHLEEGRALAAAASARPWRAMRDGNQYVKTNYLPTAECVGASRLEGVQRPWNPHAYVAFGFKPSEFETARFRDADADFIAWLANHAEQLIEAVAARETLAVQVRELEAWIDDEKKTWQVRRDGPDVPKLDRKMAQGRYDSLSVVLNKIVQLRNVLVRQGTE